MISSSRPPGVPRSRGAEFRCVLTAVLLPGLLFCLVDSCAAAETGWPNRFGPLRNGHVPHEQAAGLPVSFDESSGRNILWKTPIPESGHSTPVLLNSRIWFTSASADGKRQYVDCVDADSAQLLHHHLLFENDEPEPLYNNVNTYASPSCVVTEDALYVHFGSYGTARLDPRTMHTVWERRDIPCQHFRGPGSSPFLYQNLLILTFDGIDAQFLTALDPATGRTVWRTDRSTDFGDLDSNGKPKRNGDLRKAYSTPNIRSVAGADQLISVGSRAAFAYDPATGKELWTIRHTSFNASSPPLFVKDLAILNTGDRRAQMLGVRLNATTQGDVTDSHLVWRREKGNCRLASPLAHQGHVFMVTDGGVGICLDAATGEEKNKVRLGGSYVASPLLANDMIYACSEDGHVIVFRANEQMDVVARSQLSEGMRSSPAAAGGRLYLRTFKHLYCVADSP